MIPKHRPAMRVQAVQDLTRLTTERSGQPVRQSCQRGRATPCPHRSGSWPRPVRFAQDRRATACRMAEYLPHKSKTELVNTLASRKPWAKQLLQALKAKKIPQSEITGNTIVRIQAFNDKELNQLIEQCLGPNPLDARRVADADSKLRKRTSMRSQRASPVARRSSRRSVQSATTSQAKAKTSARSSTVRPATSTTFSPT